jgi:hypothetical protein
MFFPVLIAASVAGPTLDFSVFLVLIVFRPLCPLCEFFSPEKQKTHRPEHLWRWVQKLFRLELDDYTPGFPTPKDTPAQHKQQQQLRSAFWS